MNDLLSALLLGIIEGITEFLPISSTGHLLIAEHWLGARSDLFNIAIQAGAILAVVVIYWQRLWSLLVGFAQKANRDYALKLIVAFGVTGALGLVVKKLGFELPETLAPVAWALLVGGFVILGVEAIDARRADLPDNDPDAIGWGTAVLVGLAQVLAGVFPGTSRSAAAIFAALLFGRSSRVAATEFAFLVGIPTMFAATGYELLHTLKDGGAAGENWTALGVAFVVSALTAFAAVKWLLLYIQTHRFTIFAWYRIVFGAALLAWLAFGAAPATVAAPAPTNAPAQAVAGAESPPAASAAIASPSAPAIATASSASANPLPDDPAKSALRRQIAHLVQCNEARNERVGFLADPMNEKIIASRKDTPEGRRDLAAFERKIDEMQRQERACADTKDTLENGDSYELALRAADQGIAQAAHCFVAARFPMPARMREHPEMLAQWRLDAGRLMDQGIAQGDWSLAYVAALAYEPRQRDTPAPAFLAPWYAPDWSLTESLGGPRGNAAMAYRLQRLLALGAATPEAAANNREWAAQYAGALTPEQRRAGEAWAAQAFQRAFRGRKMHEEETALC